MIHASELPTPDGVTAEALSARAKAWPLITAIALFVAAVGGLLLLSLTHTHGQFVYALDDPYSGCPIRPVHRLAALAFALPLVRYEGLFPVIIAAALLTLRARVVHALVLAIVAAIPVAAYAVISMSQGWLWAPNSVLLKGNLPDCWRTAQGIRELLGYSGYSSLLGLPAIAFLV
jgi:hypothetical protein